MVYGNAEFLPAALITLMSGAERIWKILAQKLTQVEFVSQQNSKIATKQNERKLQLNDAEKYLKSVSYAVIPFQTFKRRRTSTNYFGKENEN